nr:lysylphosphatidylglycerol synthase transmembrane domain-containing protein [Robiginitalea sp. SC105]
MRKKGVALLKLVFSALLLYLVFRRIPFRDVWETIRESSPGFLLLALLFFCLSKVIASLRLNRYFREIGLPLTEKSNARLYLLGMFYNLFLPGGIGGDAYKGYVLHKTFGTRVRRIVGVLLLDRISGLYLLVFYSGVLLLWLAPGWLQPYAPWLILGLLLSLGAYWWVHRRFFSYAHPVFWQALSYSAGVQAAQLATAYILLHALHVDEAYLPYLLLFLLSSIVAVLPITIGGIGSRELLFFYGSAWFGLEETTAVGLSMEFFMITALVSLAGIYYHFRKPELRLRVPAGTGATDTAY